MNADHDKINQEFLIEANELIDEAEDALLLLEKGVELEECQKKIFRTLHGLKGSCAMMGYDEVAKISHLLEDFLEMTRELLLEKDQSFRSRVIAFFLEGLEASRILLMGGSHNFPKTIPNALLKEVEALAIAFSDPLIPQNNFSKIKKYNEGNGLDLIYFIDDSEEFGEHFSSLLADFNFEVHYFREAENLLDALKKEVPCLIISDIQMPEMDGEALLNELLKSYSTIPVILCSGYLSNIICRNYLRKGALALIEKPPNDEVILSIVSAGVRISKLSQALDQLISYGEKKNLDQSVLEEAKNILFKRNKDLLFKNQV